MFYNNIIGFKWALFFIKNDILFTIKGAGSMGDVEIYKYAQ